MQLPTLKKIYEPLYDHTNIIIMCVGPTAGGDHLTTAKNLLKIQSKNMMTCDLGLKLIVLHK